MKIFLKFFLSSQKRVFLLRDMVEISKTTNISDMSEWIERDQAGPWQMQLNSQVQYVLKKHKYQ